jgi:hypothetical protein
VEIFSTLSEARVLGNEHRGYYNEKRPHSPLGGKSPMQYAAHCLVLSENIAPLFLPAQDRSKKTSRFLL